MKVLFVTSEFADFAKAGGLADVSASLPRALRRRGIDVRVLMPGYPQVLRAARALSVVAYLPGRGEIEPCLLGEMRTADGLMIYVALAPTLYQREGTTYLSPDGKEWADTDLRFARLALAAAEVARGLDDESWKPDLVHLNDWPSALAAGYMKWDGIQVPSLVTIHNLAYQGLFSAERRQALAIPDWAWSMHGVEFHNQISYLKTGIFYADHVGTVSPTYAREITTEEMGCGLGGLLGGIAQDGRLTGIVNGIDEGWSPDHDAFLGHPLGIDGAGKVELKERVRTSLCLAKTKGPLFAVVSRLVHQKGLDLVVQAADEIVARGGQIAVLGVGDPAVETELAELVRKHRGQVALLNGFNEAMSHRIIAASDFFLMPSRFEPCGLTQMHAQCYGSLPVAHATGGLVDTVADGETGFLFEDFSVGALLAACDRAFAIYGDRVALARMRGAAMARDFGWSASARRYEELYARITGIAVGAQDHTPAAVADEAEQRRVAVA